LKNKAASLGNKIKTQEKKIEVPVMAIQKSKSLSPTVIATSSKTEQDAYVVQKIIADRVVKGQREFNVKWGVCLQIVFYAQGYSSDENTWEPEAGLGDCKREIDLFMKSKVASPVKSKAITPAKKTPPKSKADSPMKRPASTTNAQPIEKRVKESSPAKEEEVIPGNYIDPQIRALASWEKEVRLVETISRGKEGELIATVRWNNNKLSTHLCSVVNAKCPQKVSILAILIFLDDTFL
jgi:hypothetical protein